MYINGLINNIKPIINNIKPIINNIEMSLENYNNTESNNNIYIETTIPKNNEIQIINTLYNNSNFSTEINILNKIPGLTLGIPLNILQYIFTYIHYNYNIINLNLICLQFGIGITTYGTDRFLDSFSIDNTTTKDKIIYYNYLQKNKNNIMLILLCSYIYVSTNILYYDNTDEVFALLCTTLFYKVIKEKIGILKSTYIATAWTCGCIILPSIIHDNNYDIYNDYETYLSLFLLLFGTSNIADIKDIEEDKKNNITTIPVLFGKKKTIIISYYSIALFSYLLFSKININY